MCGGHARPRGAAGASGAPRRRVPAWPAVPRRAPRRRAVEDVRPPPRPAAPRHVGTDGKRSPFRFISFCCHVASRHNSAPLSGDGKASVVARRPWAGGRLQRREGKWAGRLGGAFSRTHVSAQRPFPGTRPRYPGTQALLVVDSRRGDRDAELGGLAPQTRAPRGTCGARAAADSVTATAAFLVRRRRLIGVSSPGGRDKGAPGR